VQGFIMMVVVVAIAMAISAAMLLSAIVDALQRGAQECNGAARHTAQ
jgi:hypothetical protein